MTATFIHQGDAIDHVPATDLPAGAVVVLTDLIGITTRPIPAGHLGALQLVGVFDVPKEAGLVLGVGAPAYWHAGSQEARATDDDGALFLGHVVAAAADTDATVRVRLAR